jgi:hypothetical protein
MTGLAARALKESSGSEPRQALLAKAGNAIPKVTG